MRTRAILAVPLLLLSAMAALVPSVAADHCGVGYSVASVTPTGNVPSGPGVIRATFNHGYTCPHYAGVMTLNGVPVPATFSSSATTFVVEWIPPAQLPPGVYTVAATAKGTCCPGAGADELTMTWSFTRTGALVAPITVPIGTAGIGQTVSTPASVSIGPATTVGPLATPAVPATPVVTPAVAVPATCAPASIVCAGPYTVPAQNLGSTPPVASVPLIGATPVPPATTVTLPVGATATVNLATIAGSVTVDPAGSTAVGPVPISVPTPFGPLPVTVCAVPCPVPDPTAGGVGTSLTVSGNVAGTPFSVSQPIVATLP